mgnify:CR=1 FL=1
MSESIGELLARAHEVANKAYALHANNDGWATLLAALLLKLDDVGRPFGSVSTEILPVNIGTNPSIILDVEPQRRVRHVDVWLDTAVGGPVPTVRIGIGGANTNNSGPRLTAGQRNELGPISGNVRLYAVSSVAIQGFVVPRV